MLNRALFLVTILFVQLLLPSPSLANSSWHWLTTLRPWHLLPVGIVLTISIEAAFIYYYAEIGNKAKVLYSVVIGNILSFLVPYLIVLRPMNPGDSFPNMDSLESWPFYSVGIFYLIITVAIETPFVYFFLRNICLKKKRLVFSILGGNIFTTIFVGALERIFTYGQW